MGMVKIPIRTSWAKITWHRKKERKIKTISKDNKIVDSLIAQIKKVINCLHRGFGTFQSFIKLKRKT